MVFHLFTQKLISTQMKMFNQMTFPAVPKFQDFFFLTELKEEDLGNEENSKHKTFSPHGLDKRIGSTVHDEGTQSAV